MRHLKRVNAGALSTSAPVDNLLRRVLDTMALEWTLKDSRAIVSRFFEELAAEVKRSGRVKIPRFGTFRLAKTKGRRIANPNTGEPMQLKPTTRIAFSAAKCHKTGGLR